MARVCNSCLVRRVLAFSSKSLKVSPIRASTSCKLALFFVQEMRESRIKFLVKIAKTARPLVSNLLASPSKPAVCHADDRRHLIAPPGTWLLENTWLVNEMPPDVGMTKTGAG